MRPLRRDCSHWHNVQARLLSMFGLFAVTTPRNDASSAVGQWDLQGAYKYFSEANAGYHWDVNPGLNVDAGIFVSYTGLFSYYNFDNWTYQPSFVSSDTPRFFRWDTQLNFRYMLKDWITWWTEFTFRHSDVPYWSGPGGVTPAGRQQRQRPGERQLRGRRRHLVPRPAHPRGGLGGRCHGQVLAVAGAFGPAAAPPAAPGRHRPAKADASPTSRPPPW